MRGLIVCLMSGFIFLCSSPLHAQVVSNNPPPEIVEKQTKAIEAAQGWLKLIDNGKYKASWDMAALVFKTVVLKEDWVKKASDVRAPFGKVASREIMGYQYTKALPGVPEGEYVIIQFKTAFQNGLKGIETITPMLEADGAWRTTGYFIKKIEETAKAQ